VCHYWFDGTSYWEIKTVHASLIHEASHAWITLLYMEHTLKIINSLLLLFRAQHYIVRSLHHKCKGVVHSKRATNSTFTCISDMADIMFYITSNFTSTWRGLSQVRMIMHILHFFSFRHLNFFDIVRLDDEKELSKRYGMVNINSSFDLFLFCFSSSINIWSKLIFRYLLSTQHISMWDPDFRRAYLLQKFMILYLVLIARKNQLPMLFNAETFFVFAFFCSVAIYWSAEC